MLYFWPLLKLYFFNNWWQMCKFIIVKDNLVKPPILGFWYQRGWLGGRQLRPWASNWAGKSAACDSQFRIFVLVSFLAGRLRIASQGAPFDCSLLSLLRLISPIYIFSDFFFLFLKSLLLVTLGYLWFNIVLLIFDWRERALPFFDFSLGFQYNFGGVLGKVHWGNCYPFAAPTCYWMDFVVLISFFAVLQEHQLSQKENSVNDWRFGILGNHMIFWSPFFSLLYMPCISMDITTLLSMILVISFCYTCTVQYKEQIKRSRKHICRTIG